MAQSKYEYTRKLEHDDICTPDKYIVIRIDGQNFHRFATVHKYSKPNDINGLLLMNYCALQLMRLFSDIILSYGMSDEYSFVLHKQSQLYQRRKNKLSSVFASNFTATFNYMYNKLCAQNRVELQYPQAFDGRCIEYTDIELRDYLCYRQCDIHINNLYLYLFHACVCSELTTQQSEIVCKQLNSIEKQQYMLEHFNIDYKSLPSIYRLGSMLIWQYADSDSEIYTNKLNIVKQLQSNNNDNSIKVSEPRAKRQLYILHESIFPTENMVDDFFTRYKYAIPYVSHNDVVKMQKKQIKKSKYLHNNNDGTDETHIDNVNNDNSANSSTTTNNDKIVNEQAVNTTQHTDNELLQSNGNYDNKRGISTVLQNVPGYVFNETDQLIAQLERQLLDQVNAQNNNTHIEDNDIIANATIHIPIQSTIDWSENLDKINKHIYFITDKLQLEHINLNLLLATPECGAVSTFAGFTRQNAPAELQITCLYYECYLSLVNKQLHTLIHNCQQQYTSVHRIVFIHKLGSVRCNECSILIGVSSPHRNDSLQATQYLIENTKKYLSIFKKEVYVDNTYNWNSNKEYNKYNILNVQQQMNLKQANGS